MRVKKRPQWFFSLLYKGAIFLHSIRFHLTLWYVLTVACLVLVFGCGVYILQSRNIVNNVDKGIDQLLYEEREQVVTLAHQGLLSSTCRSLKQQGLLGQNGHDVIVAFDVSLMPLFSCRTLQAKEQRQLIALWQAGKSARTINLSLYETPPAHSEVAIDARLYLFPVEDALHRPVLMVVGASREKIQQDEQFLLQTLLLPGCLLLILSTLGGYGFALKVLHPIRVITHAACEMKETDLHRRLNLNRNDELGELAATFDQMIARLGTGFERQRQFIAETSHELRTPLTIVNLEVNQALSPHATLEQCQQSLKVIRGENEQMSRVVNQLLLLAKADAQQMSLHWEIVDLSGLVVDVVERLIPLMRAQSICLHYEALPELYIRADITMLTSLITNLVENALKYTSGYGNRISVCTYEMADARNDWAVLRVQDNGQGIAQEHLPHIFERFYRVQQVLSTHEQMNRDIRSSITQRGAGLGLSIVNWVAQLHQGEMSVQSEVGSGSIFEAKIPLPHLPEENVE